MVNGTESGASRAAGTGGNAQARLARRLADELRHSADLALFADVAPTRWTDALLAETRFQLAGTMNAVEMAIRLEVSEGDIEVRLSGLPQPWCGPALERHVDLLTPELLAHYRLRGALSVVQRERADPSSPGHRDGLIITAGEGPFSQALAALALAEQRWTGPMLFDAPLRPDLPAEIFCDLAWTVAALLLTGLVRSQTPGDRDATPAIVQAVERIISRHDEGGGPFALAQRCARALSAPERQRIAPLALIERRLLLFCALVEGETALPIESVLDALIDGGDIARQSVLRLMAQDEAVAVQLFEMLAPLTGGSAGQDVALMQFVEEYRATTHDDAEAWLGRMRTPSALAAKLSRIDPAA
ncbi:MAG: hypothetical protein J7485_08650 [Sphingobium sp.]|nr:hypothetical protein [Sphingobium sp.]